ncbi:MAG: TetR/AcrR family transcriptional regulator [Actinomycetota bacterium]
MADPTGPPFGDADGAGSDGRSLRRQRNREAVIDALIGLINEGDLTPGAKQIAERAGVSHRSVFRYFDDMTDLVETAVRREFVAAATLAALPRVHPESPLATRIDALVESRLVWYRSVANAANVARHQSARYRRISEEMTGLAAFLRRELLAYFAPELDGLEEETRIAVTEAVMTLTSFDAWDLARRVYRHYDEQIRRSWSTALDVLLCNAAALGTR